MKSNSDYQYSIIIPHYNIPRLLRRCLWSIPKREDTQIIVIDDKSNEETVNEMHKLEIEYPYVEFVYLDLNGGGGRARNIGLKRAKGKYVLFADADDFFNYCIYDVLERYKRETCDIVFFNATCADTDTYMATSRMTILNQYMEKYEKSKDVTCFKYMFGEPWCKLVLRSLIVDNHIHFDETPIHNDTTFSYMIGYYAKNIKVENIGLYTLTNRANSVSKKITSENLITRVMVFSKKNSFFQKHNIPLFDNMMLLPFKLFLQRGDFANLGLCYDVAAENGLSKTFINIKLFIYIINSKTKNRGKRK